MNNRIKEVREKLGLSQREFGERLGVSRDVISNIEYNRADPKELFIKHLCETYTVNESWLKSGTGKMFLSDSLDADRKLQEAAKIFKELNPDFQDYVLEQIQSLIKLQDKRKE